MCKLAEFAPKNKEIWRNFLKCIFLILGGYCLPKGPLATPVIIQHSIELDPNVSKIEI